MGLRIKQPWWLKTQAIVTLIAVLALAVQPLGGFVSGVVAHAEAGQPYIATDSSGLFSVESLCNTNRQVVLKLTLKEDIKYWPGGIVTYKTPYGHETNDLHDGDIDNWSVNTGAMSIASVAVTADAYGYIFGWPHKSYSVNSVARSCNATPVVHAMTETVTTNEVLTGQLAATDADTGDTVTFSKISDTNHGTLVVNDDGSYTYTPNTNFSGVDSFTYRANDGYSNSGVATVTVKVMPTAPSGLLVNGKTGPYYTNSDSEQLRRTWTASQGTIDHYVYHSYTSESSANTPGNDGYTKQVSSMQPLEVPGVSDHTFWWRVDAVDTAGNVTPSQLYKVVFDGNAPTISDLQLVSNNTTHTITASDLYENCQTSSGTLYNVRGTIAFSGVLADDGSGVKKGNYAIRHLHNNGCSYTDGQLGGGLPLLNSRYTGEFNTQSFDDGNYVLVFRSFDQLNNHQGQLIHLYIDNTNPWMTVKSASGNSQHKIFNKISLKLRDNHDIDYYVINQGESNEYQSDSQSSKQWGDANYNNIKGHLKQGTNTFTLYDAAGNKSSVYRFTYDNKKPDIAITAPTTNKSTNAHVYVSNQSAVTVSGTATDETAGIQYVSVKATDLGSNTTRYEKNNVKVTDGKWSVQIPAGNMKDNDHIQLQVFGRDKTTVNSDTAKVWFYVDNTSPTIAIDGDSPVQYYDGSTGIHVHITEDNYQKTTIHRIGTSWTQTYNAPQASFSLAWMDDGTYEMTAYDKANNASKTYIFTIDTTNPTAAITSASQVSKDKVVITDGSVQDSNLNYYYCWLTTNQTITLNGVTYTPGQEVKPSAEQGATSRDSKCNTTWANEKTSITGVLGGFDVTDFPTGDYTVHLAAVDKAGNAYGTDGSVAKIIHIDHTAPTLPTITPQTDTIKGVQTFTITSDEPITFAGSDQGTLVDNHDGTWSLNTTTMMRDATVTITATATDAAGNTATNTATYTVKNDAPLLQVDKDESDSSSSHTLTGTVTPATDLTTVTVHFNGEDYSATVNPTTGVWTVPIDVSELHRGPYEYTVTANDGYNNTVTSAAYPLQVGPVQTTTVSGVESLVHVHFGNRDDVQIAGEFTPHNDDEGLPESQAAAKGASTTNDGPALAPSSDGWKLFHIAWYWWFVIIAAIIAFVSWLAGAIRRRQEQEV